MVYFTCNHCGDSLKKPTVEKHYNFKCRAPKFLTCVDCLKDFRLEEYAVHTSCITELEKYSGKGFVAKASKNSGQKKQESWLEIVRTILDKENGLILKPSVLGIFRKLQTYDNVPRKKVKFQNFVSSCMNINKDSAEAVWAILEKGIEKFYENRYIPGQNKDNKVKEDENKCHEEKDNKNVAETNENLEKKSKKKKNKRSAEEIENVEGTVTGEDSLNNNSATEPKRRKSLKADEIENVIINTEPHNNDVSEGEPKKKKKKSLNVDKDEQIENVGVIEESSKKNKRKSLKNGNGPDQSFVIDDENGIDVNKDKFTECESNPTKTKNKFLENGADNDNLDSVSSKKKNKSKKNSEYIEETVQKEQSMENNSPKKKSEKDVTTFAGNTNEKRPSKKRLRGIKKYAFSWDETMFKVLEKHSNGLSVEDLKKKTLKIFKKERKIEEMNAKIMKTFDKKLRKSGLVIDYDGIVKIK